jgi:hypothetical protein
MEGTALMKVWYFLVDHDGNPYNNFTPSRLLVDSKSIVDDLKHELCNSYAKGLPEISPPQLLVYLNKNSFDTREEGIRGALESTFLLHGLGTTEA